MPNQLPADLTPNTMLVASLILVVLLLIVFFRKSLLADRLMAAAERRADAAAERANVLEDELQRAEPTADREDVTRLLEELPLALRVPDDARTVAEMSDALGAGITRLLSPEQWMVFADTHGDGKEFGLVAAGSASGATWPVGACLTPQMGRVGLAIRRKRLMERTDFLAEPPIVRSQIEETEPDVFQVDLVAPIVVANRVVGAVALGGSKFPGDLTRAVVQVIAEQAVVLHRLLTARQRAERLENLDDVTGLHNRNWFTAHGSELLFQNRDQMVSIVCGVFGIDDFQTYAGREGPSETRNLLRGVANIVRPLFRSGDLVCRWGEDEFAVFLPNMNRGAAREMLDDIRHRVATTHFHGAEHQPEGAVTVSVGMAVAPDDGQSFDELIDHAFRAYQTSRVRGGDRTSGEVAVDDEFLDVVSGLAHETPLRAPEKRSWAD